MKRFLKRLCVGLLALGSVLLALYVFRAPLLRGAAQAWIVDDPLEQADAIVLLGGGLETRPFAAARLYQAGYAPRILVTRPVSSPSDELGLTTREKDVAIQVLIKQGVPESAITGIGAEVQSTYEEALAVCEWSRTNDVKSLIIPTDFFHTRRVRWTFQKKLGAAGIKATVQAVPVREYQVGDWWQHEKGVVAFQNEILKHAFYRWNY